MMSVGLRCAAMDASRSYCAASGPRAGMRLLLPGRRKGLACRTMTLMRGSWAPRSTMPPKLLPTPAIRSWSTSVPARWSSAAPRSAMRPERVVSSMRPSARGSGPQWQPRWVRRRDAIPCARSILASSGHPSPSLVLSRPWDITTAGEPGPGVWKLAGSVRPSLCRSIVSSTGVTGDDLPNVLGASRYGVPPDLVAPACRQPPGKSVR